MVESHGVQSPGAKSQSLEAPSGELAGAESPNPERPNIEPASSRSQRKGLQKEGIMAGRSLAVPSRARCARRGPSLPGAMRRTRIPRVVARIATLAWLAVAGGATVGGMAAAGIAAAGMVAPGLAGCARSHAQVEEATQTGWRKVALELTSFQGTRDGYRTQATVLFEGPGGGKLDLRLTVTVDPQPALEGGTWTWNSPTGPLQGAVVPESLRFAGGQGEGASLGGRFLLQQDGRTRLRVVLPAQSLRTGYR
jgi:hypothetical protein